MGELVFQSDPKQVIHQMGRDRALRCLEQMWLIRHFETRAEAAYLQGKIGGFFHSYVGQEAIQTAAVEAMGLDQWWTTSYRCHALALLLGASPNELMAELYGRSNGNAKGRGGSMHLYTQQLLGGFGIVGGQIPIATGAAFTLKYRKQEGVSVVFLGDGAVAQGSFHESLNIAALWDLPCIYVIENNQWGMGTAVNRAISCVPIAKTKAVGYGIKGYTFDGMDLCNCFAGFSCVFEEVVQTSRPVLVEVVTQRFRGHSISDPALYRSKEELADCVKHDPILSFVEIIQEEGWIDQEEHQRLSAVQKQKIVDAMNFAEQSPWPDPIHLGEDVFAP